MNRAQQISKYQNLELEKGIFDIKQSFHGDFESIPFIIVRGLSYELSEGDIMTVFEQYGTIIEIELKRDQLTGKSKGVCIIKYEDWRSTILSVDNFNNILLCGKNISVDHIKYEYGPKSKMIDPRSFIPARLKNNNVNLPQFDEGSASSTDIE